MYVLLQKKDGDMVVYIIEKCLPLLKRSDILTVCNRCISAPISDLLSGCLATYSG